MEKVILKLKIGTSHDPRDNFPSERRYSASLVLGFSAIFVVLFIFSSLIGAVIVHKIALHNHQLNAQTLDELAAKGLEENSTEAVQDDSRLEKRVLKDLLETGDNIHYNINMPALICGGCFLMSLGYFFSAATGLLAWKRWYIDHNITFFFLLCCFSNLTSAISLLLILLYGLCIETSTANNCSPISLSLTVFISILSLVGLLWSCLASKLAFLGMKNYYPDDSALSKQNNGMEVQKDNKNCGVVQQDFLSLFTNANGLSKYFPKKDHHNNLPKAESNFEYQQRVNRFLAENCTAKENKY